MSGFFEGIFNFVAELLPNVTPRSSKQRDLLPLTFHNTLSNTPESFSALKNGLVKMYNCGPTVYGPQHVGNLSMFVFTDILRRTLEYAGYDVRQVINFTDFGHLTSDADEGEDKMTKGLKREGLKPTLANMRVLATKYEALFLKDIAELNIETRGIKFPRASEYVNAQIAMIVTLEEKGYAYPTSGGVYFDTHRFPSYGALGNIHLESLKEGARVATDTEKRNPTDFLLWKSDKKMGWDSPWGVGFPGWHIECSAMIRSILGEQIDIHTGGIEHIPIHHNNEIAQSEAASGKKPFSRFWLHRAHLQIEGGKMAKSLGNTIYLADIVTKKYHPLAFRYLLLGSHYRATASFTWEALAAAQTAFLKLRKFVDSTPEGGDVSSSYLTRFKERIADDLDTAGVLALTWEMMKDSSLSAHDVRAGILEFDTILGLAFDAEDEKATKLWKKQLGEEVSADEIPVEIQELLVKREEARASKNYTEADKARLDIETAGYVIEDTPAGPRVVARK